MSRKVLAALCVASLVLSTAAAQADEPFYKGKQLTLLINFAPGGPTDIEGRLLAKHIVKHIDGNPTVIVENKDGAAGMVGAGLVFQSRHRYPALPFTADSRGLGRLRAMAAAPR